MNALPDLFAKFDTSMPRGWKVMLFGLLLAPLTLHFGALRLGGHIGYVLDRMRESVSLPVTKCVYERLPYPTRSGGLEKAFIERAQADSSVEAFCKISETGTPLHGCAM